MVFGSDDGNRIVSSFSGSGTCDTIYVTADGRHWLYNPTIRPPRFDRTGPSGLGKIVGNRIFDD